VSLSLSILKEMNEMNERASVYYTFSRTAATYIHARRIYIFIFMSFSFLSRPKFVDGHLLLFAGPPHSLTGDQLGVRALIVVVQGVSELFTTA
jgi:hypothetical protein